MSDHTHPPRSEPLLQLRDIRKTYDAVERAAAPVVLEQVSLTVEAGESLAVIGPSGSGKSTLLNIIGALVRPTAGEVRFEGDIMTAMSDDELAAFRNRSLGFVFQSHHLLPQCSALENVLIPTLVHPNQALRGDAPNRARALLDRVGLGDRMSHRPAQLSGGECQRVAVVRALINQPKLLLADEPTGSLDETSADQLGQLLADLNRDRNVTLIMVTHSSRLAARMGRQLVLHRGRLEDRSGDE